MAATYMKPKASWGCVPALQAGPTQLIDNEDKSRTSLESFFPELNPPDPYPSEATEQELPWEAITELGIQRSLSAAKGTTAPGQDCLPMLAWKNLWSHLKSIITNIFTACLDLGHHPKQWRSAKARLISLIAKGQ
jgi:hypothetical protein